MIRPLAALLLNLALGAALLAPAPHPPRVDPIAPALTRIATLGDRPIGGDAARGAPGGWRLALDRTVRAVGTPEQRRAAESVRPPPPPAGDLRAVLQADAVAMARVLGPDRVAAFVAERERLSGVLGEGRVWSRLGGTNR